LDGNTYPGSNVVGSAISTAMGATSSGPRKELIIVRAMHELTQPFKPTRERLCSLLEMPRLRTDHDDTVAAERDVCSNQNARILRALDVVQDCPEHWRLRDVVCLT
jgi:hypothetical protein